MFAKVLYLRPNRYTSFKSPTDDRFDIDSCLSSKYRKSKCEFGADVLYNHEMKFVFLSPTDEICTFAHMKLISLNTRIRYIRTSQSH